MINSIVKLINKLFFIINKNTHMFITPNNKLTRLLMESIV